MMSIIFFATSILMFSASVARHHRSAWLVATSALYCVFCFVAMAREQGIIPTPDLSQIISQQGYDTTRIPGDVTRLAQWGLLGGCCFNLFTAAWIWYSGGFWKYCIISTLLFCMTGLCIGLVVGIPPLYSLYGLCCGFMASVAWVLGLTYVDFCVIGNIYIPALAMILSALWLAISAIKSNHRGRVAAMATAVIQIAVALGLLCHYAGDWTTAFYQCVRDLKGIAGAASTGYEAVNIIIYVVIIPLVIAADLLAAFCYFMKSR